MPFRISSPINFGQFLVTPQVFHITPLSFGLVNIKPLLPGHVLVCPRRVVPRLHDLTPDESADLFRTVQRISRMLERVYQATALNVAIQDGVDAGQSVPHVHMHIIPRQKSDLDHRGEDAIYDMMNGEEGDLNKAFGESNAENDRRSGEGQRRGAFPGVDADARKPRSSEEMNREASWLAEEMEKEEVG